jgi:hypothetical protein
MATLRDWNDIVFIALSGDERYVFLEAVGFVYRWSYGTGRYAGGAFTGCCGRWSRAGLPVWVLRL